MKKVVLSIVAVFALVLAGCQSPITKWQLNKGQDKMEKAMEEAAKAKQGKFSYGVSANLKGDALKGGVKIELNYSGYSNTADINNPDAEGEMELKIKLPDLKAMGVTDELTEGFTVTDWKTISMKFSVVEKGQAVYVKPEIAKNGGKYVGILSGSKYLFLDQASMIDAVKQIDPTIDLSALNEITSNSTQSKSAQELAAKIQKELSGSMSDFSEKMEVVKKSDGEYVVEISKEKMLTQVVDVVETMVNSFMNKEGLNMIKDVYGEQMGEDFEMPSDEELADFKKELKDGLKEAKSEVSKVIKTDPIEFKIKFNGDDEIEKLTMSDVRIDLGEEDMPTLDLGFSFSATELNKKKTVKIPADSEVMKLPAIATAVKASKIEDIINKDLFKMFGITNQGLIDQIIQGINEGMTEEQSFDEPDITK